MGKCSWLWSIVWLVVLVFLAWPIGFFVSFFYLVLSPLGACIEALTPLINILESGVKLPLTCALNMVHQKALC